MVVMITSEEYKELVIKANKYDESQNHKCVHQKIKLKMKLKKLR